MYKNSRGIDRSDYVLEIERSLDILLVVLRFARQAAYFYVNLARTDDANKDSMKVKGVFDKESHKKKERETNIQLLKENAKDKEKKVFKRNLAITLSTNLH